MINTDKSVVVLSVRGRVVEEKIIDKKFIDVVKEIARKALEKWDPSRSGFDVIPYEYEIEKPLPLKPEEVDIVMKLNPVRIRDRVVIKLPLFIISYKNYRSGEHTIDEEVYVVAPYISDEYISIVEKIAIYTTSEEE